MDTEEKIILYSTHCPNCRVLERKLNDKKIEYETIDDIDTMTKIGIQSAPVLKVNDKTLRFAEALRWVNQYGNNN